MEGFAAFRMRKIENNLVERKAKRRKVFFPRFVSCFYYRTGEGKRQPTLKKVVSILP